MLLTEKGRKLKEDLANCASDVIRIALESFTETEQIQIKRVLEKIWRLMTDKQS